MKIHGLAVGPLQANAYLAICEQTQRCALVDPGAEPEALLTAVAEEQADVDMVLLTHAHLDHVAGVKGVVRETGGKVFLHRADWPLYRAVPEQARAFGLMVDTQPGPDGELEDGQLIEIGAEKLEVRYTPGHSPGHVSFVGEGFALVGDCVFAGSIGRTDLPGGDYRTLIEAIQTRLLTLPNETVLYPGHGPATTVGHERRYNPFLTGAVGWSG